MRIQFDHYRRAWNPHNAEKLGTTNHNLGYYHPGAHEICIQWNSQRYNCLLRIEYLPNSIFHSE